jgi:hypothetical protein
MNVKRATSPPFRKVQCPASHTAASTAPASRIRDGEADHEIARGVRKDPLLKLIIEEKKIGMDNRLSSQMV